MKTHTININRKVSDMEDKQKILDALLVAINATRAGNDVTNLRYDKEKEVVYVDFESGECGRIINVAMDSGIALLKDVINNIDIG